MTSSDKRLGIQILEDARQCKHPKVDSRILSRIFQIEEASQFEEDRDPVIRRIEKILDDFFDSITKNDKKA
ncbi:protein of unknown function [uncultured Woeseiaceae bacterium]|uniref:Uncharacterized protein n=1 Tax=uncultured Woeseiaceae bacterium TaxID=1983305 RepID=A0A7D9H380_9GAMM|nr:protein of unknown function [uncultured Woeseiaceae bacterium]